MPNCGFRVPGKVCLRCDACVHVGSFCSAPCDVRGLAARRYPQVGYRRCAAWRGPTDSIAKLRLRQSVALRGPSCQFPGSARMRPRLRPVARPRRSGGDPGQLTQGKSVARFLRVIPEIELWGNMTRLGNLGGSVVSATRRQWTLSSGLGESARLWPKDVIQHTAFLGVPGPSSEILSWCRSGRSSWVKTVGGRGAWGDHDGAPSP